MSQALDIPPRLVFDKTIYRPAEKGKQMIKDILETEIKGHLNNNPGYIYESIERRVLPNRDYEYRIVLRHYLVLPAKKTP